MLHESGTFVRLTDAEAVRPLPVPKEYAAGLEMLRPGGALFQAGALKFPANGFQQWPCHRMLAG